MTSFPVKVLAALLTVGLATAACTGSSRTADGAAISIESWRTDDAAIWSEHVIPAFESQFPGIEVEFTPTDPTQYDSALAGRLAAGTAGDIIACRPFDASLTLFERGHLAPITDLAGMENFRRSAQSPWTADDGTTPYCVPLASVIHGFIYNQTAFDQLGLTEPTTAEEFFDLLDAIRDDGRYVPLAMGAHDRWEAATLGFQNIGPNYWKGEHGRLALIDGTARLSDQAYVDTLAALQRWGAYLPADASAVTYADAQQMFISGAAAIYPAGSWEIAGFAAAADFELGAFGPPPLAGQDACYISDHADIGLGMNPATEHSEAARTFLAWAASSQFAEIFSNALPGFFTLRDSPVALEHPLAQEFVSWRDECESTIRNSSQFLSRGEPSLEHELWDVSASVLIGNMDPIEGTQRLQAALDTWYAPKDR